MKDFDERSVDENAEDFAEKAFDEMTADFGGRDFAEMPELDFAADRSLEKTIEKQINRRIVKICLRTLLVVAGAAAVLALVINPVMKQRFLDPRPMFAAGTEAYFNDFTEYMRVYFETAQPWTEVYSAECEDRGFAAYDISLSVVDTKGTVSIGGPANVKMRIERGKIRTEDPGNIASFMANRFTAPPGGTEALTKIREEIAELPDSSVVYLSVGTKEEKPVSEVVKGNISVDWVEIWDDKSSLLGGMTIEKRITAELEDNRADMSDEELKQEYLKNLDILLSEPELLNALGVRLGSADGYTRFMGTIEPVKDLRNNVEEMEMLTTRHYSISGKKQEILEYLDTVFVTSMMVDQVKLSILER